MKFTKLELWRIEQALYSAIDNEKANIDAYRTEFNKKYEHAYLHQKVVPKEHRPMVAKLNRTIKAWQKILEKMRSGE